MTTSNSSAEIQKPARSVRLESLVFARGLAAAIVVFHHAGSIASQPRFFGEDAFGGILTRFTGVSFFFVLSGFFIGWVNWKSIGASNATWSFVTKRLSRIYPSYWLVLIPLIILYQVFPNAGDERQRDIVNVFFSIFLLPYPDQPVLGVAWTLVHELLFCMVFAAVIFFGQRAVRFLFVWAAAIVAVNLFFKELPFPVSFYFNVANLQFLMGILTARLIKERTVPLPAGLLATGIVVYLGFMVFGMHLTTDYFFERVIWATGACLIIAGLTGIERKRPILLPKSMMAFGVASYSIYLIHPIALSFAVHALYRLPTRELPLEVVVVMLAVIGITAGVLFDLLIEAPLARRVREWVDGKGRKLYAEDKTVSQNP